MKPPPLIPVTAPLDEIDDAPLQKFWWLKRLSLLAATLILLIFLSRAWMIHSENRRLNAEFQRWKQAGLPILPGDFETPPVPDDQNAAVAISLAAMAVVENKEWLDTWDELEQVPLSANARRVADAILRENVRALQAVRNAHNLTQVRWKNIDYKAYVSGAMIDPHQPNWTKLRALANLLSLSAKRAIDRGDEAEFIEALADARLISRTLAQHPNIISDMVSNGIDALAKQTAILWVHALRLHGPDSVSTRKRAIWLMHEWAGDRGSQVQLTLANEARNILDGTNATAPNTKYRYINERVQPITIGAFDVAAWRFLLPHRVRAVSDELVQIRSDIETKKALNWSTAGISATSITRATSAGVEPLDSAIEVEVPSPNDKRNYFRARFRGLVSARLAAASLACRLYAIEHGGNEPSSLNELVPRYLSAVPTDPFSPNGGPIQYVLGLQGNGTFIYSLCDTGVDTIASGAFKPTLADHMSWQRGVVVAFLNPQPSVATTATQPASTQPLNQ